MNHNSNESALFQAKQSKLKAGTVVNAIVETGVTLRKAINDFSTAEVTPAINDLNNRYVLI